MTVMEFKCDLELIIMISMVADRWPLLYQCTASELLLYLFIVKVEKAIA